MPDRLDRTTPPRPLHAEQLRAAHERLIRRREVLHRTGFSNTTLWRKYTAGEFPKPRQIGPNSVAWLESEVDSWIDERRREAR